MTRSIRLKACLALVALAASLPASADFAVRLNSGELVTATDGIVESADNAAATFAGIPVSEISAIHASALEQAEAGGYVEPAPAGKITYILDCTERNSEVETSTRQVYSTEYMLEVAGLPYAVTQDIDLATSAADAIVITSRVRPATFTDDEIDRLAEFVSDGGILFAPAVTVTSAKAMNLFGIASYKYSTSWAMDWVDGDYPELAYIDAPEERRTVLARVDKSTKMAASLMEVDTDIAEALAYFVTDEGELGSAAVVRRPLGKGTVYSWGPRWHDMVQRSQLNKDYKSNKSNTFDGMADVPSLFIRAAVCAGSDVKTWKYTIPDGYATVLIPTHDLDSRTAYDAMYHMADYEESLGLKAHYFATVHYWRQQPYMSAFYNDETIPLLQRVLEQGHTVGSHSLCHYPDFSNTENFPLTVVTRDEYPDLTGWETYENSAPSGCYGSTWAEVVLSKQILEGDLGNRVRSFRSGHLCINNNMPTAYRMGNYSFSSCYNASDVQSQFPFIARENNTWDGDDVGCLLMPLHFSDVFTGDDKMDDDNWNEKPALWFEIMQKLSANYAPSIILIHPNREWKMLAERDLIDLMDNSEQGLYNFEAYGDFWLARRDFAYTAEWREESGQVVITATAADIEANQGLGIVVETAQEIRNITLTDELGTVRPIRIKQLTPTRFVAIM